MKNMYNLEVNEPVLGRAINLVSANYKKESK